MAHNPYISALNIWGESARNGMVKHWEHQFHCGHQTFLTLAMPFILDAVRSKMIYLVKWNQSMDYQKSIFCWYGSWKRINEFLVLWVLGHSCVDNNNAFHFCMLRLTVWDETVTLSQLLRHTQNCIKVQVKQVLYTFIYIKYKSKLNKQKIVW